MLSGEAWHPDVRKLNVISESDGHLGVLYCDLFSRPEKAERQAAHYTVRCSRRIDNDAFMEGEVPINDGMLCSTQSGKKFQLPIIALLCDFCPAGKNSFSSLTFSQVNTLFHEMGHAVHCMSSSDCV